MSDVTLTDQRWTGRGATNGARRALTFVLFWSITGFVIRVVAARGDLWLDEIWSIRLLARTASPWDILFALPYDSNHPLNSLWLALVGPRAPPIVARFASIVEGTACIPLAAFCLRRHAPRFIWIGAAFVALSPIFVQFASEARGYAGLMLGALLALISADAYLAGNERFRPLAFLSAATAFGTFAHPTMIVMSAVLAATAAISLARREPTPRAILVLLIPLIVAILIGAAPAAIAWFASISHMPPHFGGMTPWSWSSFLLGLGRMSEATFGLPLVDSLALPSVLFGVIVAFVGLGLMPPERRVFPALAVFGVPALQAALRVPNEEYARFHLVTALGLSLLTIAAVAAGIQQTGLMRRAAIAFAAVVGIGQTNDLVHFLMIGRGNPTQIVKTITAGGPASVAVEQDWIVRETKLVIDWVAERGSQPVDVQPLACPGRTQWLIRVDQPGGAVSAPPEIESPASCATRYRLRETQPAYGLSGFTWHLYRRLDEARVP